MRKQSIINLRFVILTALLSAGVVSQGAYASLGGSYVFDGNTRISVDDVQNALLISGARWKAGKNKLTSLTRKELQRMMGSLDYPALKEVSFSSQFGANASGIVGSVDWRNKNSVNFVSPVMNQGNCGSCVSFAAVATLETQMNIAAGAQHIFNPHYSTQALFACGGGGCDSGWWPSSAAEYLVSDGVPDEACAPYTMGATGSDVDCSSICNDAKSRSTKIVRSVSPSFTTMSLAAVKTALQKGPLMTTLTVYDDFVTYTSGIYKHTTGGALGGHAVSLVGYNDMERYWIVRNSWGSDWGEQGFIRVSYDDTSGIADSTWGFEVAPVDGFLKIETPINRQFVSDSIETNIVSTYAKLDNVKVSLQSVAAKKQVFEAACAAQPCHPVIDTTKLADGEYQLDAQGSNQGKNIAAQPQRFWVVNQVPQMSIAFNGKDVNLAQPVSDRIEFEIKMVSGATPMSRLIFHAKRKGDPNAAEFKKETSIVLPEMTMGWRTPAVTNGDYEIWFEGELPVHGEIYRVESARLSVQVAN